MIALAPEDLADLRRWAICAAVVVLAHGGIAAAMVTWHEPAEGTGAAGGIVIEFAPVPLAASVPEEEIPPGPLSDFSVASPNKPVETLEDKQKLEQKVESRLDHKVEEKVETKPVDEPPPEVAPAPDPDVAVEPPPPQEVKEETAKRQVPDETSYPAASQVVAEQMAAIPVAPRAGEPNPYDSDEARTWNTQVFAVIQRNKRYPASARARGEEGVAKVVFILDRQGRLVESRITHSSGVAALDQEALALLRRAQPFPLPPAVFTGERITVTLPLRFDLK